MKKTVSTKVTNVFNELLSKEFGMVRVVSNEKTGEGYVSADDLCRILELSEKEVFPKLFNHLYTVILEGVIDKQQKMPFVDENGLYMMFLLSKKKDARFGLGKDDVLVLEENHTRQALRYMATADNVVKSGHFRVGKDIPEMTMSHLMGWWNNPNDRSTFMLQFNCQGSCYIYENIRMNVYLTKQEDDNTEVYDMTIKFLDLDDDNLEMMSYDTWIPEYAVTDNAILDYILEEMTLDGDFLEPENIDVLVILNSIVSFHRSRRV